MIAEDVIENQIEPSLKTITGLTILDGFLIHYAKDLLRGKNGLSFPCIAIQPSVENITPKNDLTSGSVVQSLQLIGAVSTKKPREVRRKLQELAQTVRKTLTVDKYDRTNKSRRPITFSECTYDLPDSKDEYAFFNMKIEFTINENWT